MIFFFIIPPFLISENEIDKESYKPLPLGVAGGFYPLFYCS